MSSSEVPKDQGAALLGVSWSFTSLATIFIGMRFYCRIQYQSRLWWDDIWMFVALIFGWTIAAMWTVYERIGGARYIPPLSPGDTIRVGRLNVISQSLCPLALCVGKLAVAALIMRLQAPCRWRTHLCWALTGAMVIWTAIHFIFVYTECRPIQKLWNPHIEGHCWVTGFIVRSSIALSSYLAFMDLALAAIPVQMIWKLQMPLKRRIAICALLSTGVFAFAAAVVKITLLPQNLRPHHSNFMTKPVLLYIWNAVEINVVIIAGCVPTIVPLIEFLRGRHPYRAEPSTSFSRKRLLFSKAAPRMASSWGTQQQHSYKPSSNGRGSDSWSAIVHDKDEWSRVPHLTSVSVRNRDVEMSDGIRISRQVDVESSELTRDAGSRKYVKF